MSNKLELPHLALLTRLLELEIPESDAEAAVWGETRRRVQARFKAVAESAVVQHKLIEALQSEHVEFASYHSDELAERLMEYYLDKFRDKDWS